MNLQARKMIAMIPFLKGAGGDLHFLALMHKLFAIAAQLKKSVAPQQVAAADERANAIRCWLKRSDLMLSDGRSENGEAQTETVIAGLSKLHSLCKRARHRK